MQQSFSYSLPAGCRIAAIVCASIVGLAATAFADRTASYVPGTLRFSQNVTLRAPVTTRDGEPSIRVDVKGNCYVGGIRGVPAGVDLWRFDLNPASSMFDPGMQNPRYLGQPDAFLAPAQDPDNPNSGGADGGGDIDISCSFPTHPDSLPVVTITSLALANISSAYSFDLGETFTLSPLTAIAPADDRQWNESTGPNRVYLLYRAPIPATGLFVQRSEDHGRTYLAPGIVNLSGTTPGYVDVDHTNGRVYVAHMGGGLQVARSTDMGATWLNSTVDNTTTHGILFDVVKVGDDGTVYATWCDTDNVYLSHSTDFGVTWAQKVRVSDNTVYKTAVMPWLEAGSAGRVAVVWYGSKSTNNTGASDWEVLFAQSSDANTATPTFRQQVISDHVTHGSNISLGGLGGANNRNLIDYFQIAIDPQGAAVIAYTDDHNDFEGHLYVTRQLDGTSLYANANGGTGQVTPASPPPLPPQDFGLPEVNDFLHDATTGLLQPILVDNAFDILWIDYSCDLVESEPAIAATMKLSSLAVVPPGVQWRMNFTANAPGTSPGVPGLSDRGDQFFMRAGVDDSGLMTFMWGTGVRADSGHINYTERGTCDFGAFDQTNGTVTMKVKLSSLNAFAAPDIADGSILSGLRGQTLEPGFEGPAGNRHPFRDHTRGGGTFTYSPCSPTAALISSFTAADDADGIRLTWQLGPGSDATSFAIERAAAASGPWSPVEVEITRAGEAFVALDRTAPIGTHWYRLTAMSPDGNVTTGPVSATRGGGLPLETTLEAPRPNPAAGPSSVEFALARTGFVDLAVFDANGRRVRTIAAGTLAAGRYTRTWDGRTDRFSTAAPGVYFYVLNTGQGVLSRRIALVE